MMDMVPNKHNGVTFCMGSYGTNLNNDLIATIHMLKGRIHFAHIRNLRFNDGMRDFEESAHLSEDGTFDMYAIIKALYEDGFDGPIRPDHGRMIWGEKAMPGYGLYDRALGAAYLRGLWEAAKRKESRDETDITGFAGKRTVGKTQESDFLLMILKKWQKRQRKTRCGYILEPEIFSVFLSEGSQIH